MGDEVPLYNFSNVKASGVGGPESFHVRVDKKVKDIFLYIYSYFLISPLWYAYLNKYLLYGKAK
jgi:hypothetical protein